MNPSPRPKTGPHPALFAPEHHRGPDAPAGIDDELLRAIIRSQYRIHLYLQGEGDDGHLVLDRDGGIAFRSDGVEG